MACSWAHWRFRLGWRKTLGLRRHAELITKAIVSPSFAAAAVGGPRREGFSTLAGFRQMPPMRHAHHEYTRHTSEMTCADGVDTDNMGKWDALALGPVRRPRPASPLSDKSGCLKPHQPVAKRGICNLPKSLWRQGDQHAGHARRTCRSHTRRRWLASAGRQTEDA